MAKTEITPEHRAAARETKAALSAAGFEATERELIMAGFISNAFETIVTVATSPVDGKAPANPERDTRAARLMFDHSTGDRMVFMRCVLLARGLIKSGAAGASDERRAGHIAAELANIFALNARV